MSMSYDFSELDKLAADLGEIPGKAAPLVSKALQVTSQNVRDAARASVSGGSRSWKGLARAIDYDLHGTTGARLGGLSAEIGYNLGRGGQAALGVIREFGGLNGAVPHNDLGNALHANEPDFQKGIEIAIKQAEKAAGL